MLTMVIAIIMPIVAGTKYMSAVDADGRVGGKLGVVSIGTLFSWGFS